ncbi:(Fe-S)-binding protein [Nitrosomonas sp.]|uniref:(Fe-S)-binding protein n=1 Tax=Nitrosomonas sp. TaxID=42353 RepID=UPI001DBEF8FD|nr:(Fe-S)-binding protein [Nitrosomonas sp.]MBX3617727.1 (Fe-S)-binding protein [Nitrosomonas sp.]
MSEKTATSKPDTVYLFGTCLIDLLYPQAGVATVKLLQHAGVRIIYPQAQTCCGQPAWNSGYREQALAVARAQLELFPKPIPIIVPSASCARMMKFQYARLFAGQPDEAEARKVASRVYELSGFLVDELNIQLHDSGAPLRVAVHTSCSARREMAVANKIPELLKHLHNVDAVEPQHAEECCGFGGTFAIKQPEISAAMVLEKCRHICATGAQQLVSQDYGCLMNIGSALEKQGVALAHQHIAEFLWERIQDRDP